MPEMNFIRLANCFGSCHSIGGILSFNNWSSRKSFAKTWPTGSWIKLIFRAKKRNSCSFAFVNSWLMVIEIGILKRRLGTPFESNFKLRVCHVWPKVIKSWEFSFGGHKTSHWTYTFSVYSSMNYMFQFLSPNSIKANQKHKIEDWHQEQTNRMGEWVDIITGDALAEKDTVMVDITNAYATHFAMFGFWVNDLTDSAGQNSLRWTSIIWRTFFIFFVHRDCCILFHWNLLVLIEQLFT